MDDGSAAQERIPVALDGVPETLLWTLYYRAQEAARPRPLLHDPMAVGLVRRLDYPFAERLGDGSRRAQWQALRAATFDQRVRRFAQEHPGGTVVALGEGLETQLWRVDDGRVRWVGVDLPETAELRRRVLPAHERRLQVDASVLDDTWMVHVDPSRGVLLTAQGLLMYLPREDVHELVRRCAQRFPGAELVLDGVPRWASTVTSRQAPAGPGRMPPPPMPWSLDDAEAEVLRRLPGIASVTRLHPPRGRGLLLGALLPLAGRLPGARSAMLSVWSVRFAA